MRALRVVVADGGLVQRSQLLALTERAGFDIVGEALEWHDVAELIVSRAADLVVVVGEPDFARGLPQLGSSLASLIFAPDAAATKEYTDAGAFAVLTPSIEPEVLAVTARMAVARAAELAEARKEAGQLRDMLETRKVVERAKGVLMRRLGIPEEDAYRRMQRASQDENRKMKEIAESILSAERLYGPGEVQPEDPR